MNLFKSNQHGVPKFVAAEVASEKHHGVEDVEEGNMDVTAKKYVIQYSIHAHTFVHVTLHVNTCTCTCMCYSCCVILQSSDIHCSRDIGNRSDPS